MPAQMTEQLLRLPVARQRPGVGGVERQRSAQLVAFRRDRHEPLHRFVVRLSSASEIGQASMSGLTKRQDRGSPGVAQSAVGER